MRIITYNVNGVRSAIRKGFLDWLRTGPADVICLQEIKALPQDITAEIAAIRDMGYASYWYPACKKGYSGVAVLTRVPPREVHYGSGHEQSDAEGRVIRLDFGEFTLVNAYFPSGTTGEVRQQYKYRWLDEFFGYLNALKRSVPGLIVCGDYNICHRAIDIHDPVSNKNSSGFLPEERAWMEVLFSDGGFLDTFRHFHPEPHHYSWWSYRANARARNKGWRIDYVNATENLRDRLKAACIYPEVIHSDHCPVLLELTDPLP
jgi:exodeoxyribonuclease-3